MNLIYVFLSASEKTCIFSYAKIDDSVKIDEILNGVAEDLKKTTQVNFDINIPIAIFPATVFNCEEESIMGIISKHIEGVENDIPSNKLICDIIDNIEYYSHDKHLHELYVECKHDEVGFYLYDNIKKLNNMLNKEKRAKSYTERTCNLINAILGTSYTSDELADIVASVDKKICETLNVPSLGDIPNSTSLGDFINPMKNTLCVQDDITNARNLIHNYNIWREHLNKKRQHTQSIDNKVEEKRDIKPVGKRSDFNIGGKSPEKKPQTAEDMLALVNKVTENRNKLIEDVLEGIECNAAKGLRVYSHDFNGCDQKTIDFIIQEFNDRGFDVEVKADAQKVLHFIY